MSAINKCGCISVALSVKGLIALAKAQPSEIADYCYALKPGIIPGS